MESGKKRENREFPLKKRDLRGLEYEYFFSVLTAFLCSQLLITKTGRNHFFCEVFEIFTKKCVGKSRLDRILYLWESTTSILCINGWKSFFFRWQHCFENALSLGFVFRWPPPIIFHIAYSFSSSLSKFELSQSPTISIFLTFTFLLVWAYSRLEVEQLQKNTNHTHTDTRAYTYIHKCFCWFHSFPYIIAIVLEVGVYLYCICSHHHYRHLIPVHSDCLLEG